MLKHIILIIVLTTLVFSTVLYGFISGGSPIEIRNQKLDQAQIAKVQSTSPIIDRYFQTNQKLPQTLNEVFNSPQTNNGLEYVKNGDFSYSLCANFLSDAPKKNFSPSDYNGYNQKYSNYKKGRYCFEYSVIDKVLSYPTPVSIPTPIPTPSIDYSKNGITNFTKDGAPYVRIIGVLIGSPNQLKFSLSTRDQQNNNLIVTIIYDENVISLGKQNLPLSVNNFFAGDKIMIESNVMKGQNNYEAKSIQNLSR